jgi:hypothetical protein
MRGNYKLSLSRDLKKVRRKPGLRREKHSLQKATMEEQGPDSSPPGVFVEQDAREMSRVMKKNNRMPVVTSDRVL